MHAQRSQKACATEPAQQLPSHTGPIGEQVRRRESLLQVLGVSVASLLAACTPAEARQDAGDGSTPGLAAPENDAPKYVPPLPRARLPVRTLCTRICSRSLFREQHVLAACTGYMQACESSKAAGRRFSKLANGVKIQQLTEGSGPQAQAGDRVVFDYVLRRSNGYFIYG